jgi:putative N-acetyltransferase (TIGR04045 family)
VFFIDPSSHDIGRSNSSAPAAFTPSVRSGIGIDAEDFRLSPTTSSERFSFHLTRSHPLLLEGYWSLRRRIFCEEQSLFEHSDRDDRDPIAYPIVAIDHHRPELADAGPAGVVGVVRILEEEPGVWFGGRLGVAAEHRRQNQIGKGLIWKAVSTAHGWGAHRFLATVQLQNVRFFRRLHWESLQELVIRGVPHQLMEADLDYYRPGRERCPPLHTTASNRLQRAA